jgi:surface-anchored protein
MKPKHALLPLLLSFIPVHAASLVTGGHIDFPAFGYVSNADVASDNTLTQGFEPHIHNEGGPDGAIIDGVRVEDEGEFEPDELILVGKRSSTIAVGSTTYFWLPETEAQAASQGVPFVGIGLEELAVADWVGGTLTLSLESFSGPGQLLLWQDDGFGGETIFLDTGNAITSFTLVAGSHTHYNWGFTEEGIYNIEFGITGNHVADGSQNGSAIYTFLIPEPSSFLLCAIAGLGLLRRKR